MCIRDSIKGKKTVCLLSGGNIDVNILSRVITRGLVTVSYTHLDVYKRQRLLRAQRTAGWCEAAGGARESLPGAASPKGAMPV